MGAYIIERKEQLLPFPIQDSPYNTPGDRLRFARYENYMTIVELARRTGLTVETISYLEGNRYKAKLPTLRVLAQALNVTVAYLGCFESLQEKTYAQKVKKARLYHGLNMKEFAEALGVDARTIRNWERNTFKPLPKHRKSLTIYLSILNEQSS